MSLFVDIDPQTIIPELINDFENQLGISLNAGDQRRQFLQGFGYVLTTVLQSIETTGINNLLQYAYGEHLDRLGELVGVVRLPADFAETDIEFSLSGVQSMAVTVPIGTRVTPDGAIFFATTELLTIESGQTTGTVKAKATETGAKYNGYIAGQINMLVDGVNFVESVRNTTESAGGADIEDDESFRERIHKAPLSFSVAGPKGAYEYFALSADASVGDVYVVRLEAGTVGIYVVKTGGVIPDEDDPVIEAVLTACSDDTRRPLTDNVKVLPAVALNTAIQCDYWISENDTAKAESIKTAVNQAVNEYKLWQTEQIGRTINPDELRKRMLNAGANRINLTNPVYTELEPSQVAQFTEITINYQGVG